MKWIRYLFTALTVLLAAGLAASALHMYSAGLSARAAAQDLTLPIYTREGCGQALLRLLPLFVPWLICGAASLLAPAPVAGRAAPSPEIQVSLLRAVRRPTLAALRLEQLQVRLRSAILCAALICGSPCVWYLADGSHFQSLDLEAVVGAALLHILPFLGLWLICACLLSRWLDKALRREAALLRQAEPLSPRLSPEKMTARPARCLPLVRAGIALAAAVLVILGILNGGLNDVLVKAINICTECIGLG